MRWKWSNVPIPEAHLIGLVAGIALHLFIPLRFFPEPWVGHALGWPLVVAGVLAAAWAVRTVADMNVAAPTRIVSKGPYALSRNPMYVGWTLVNLGVGLVVNSVWPVAFLPGVLIYTHFFAILREERFLEREFGDEYRQYRARVRRWF